MSLRIISNDVWQARLGAALLVFASLSGVESQVAYADNIRAAERGDFGRLVFEWDDPVRYAAEVVGDTLVVQFERPVTTDIAESAQTLNTYVAGGRFAPDRRSIFLPLRAGVSMRTFTVRNVVVVDLVKGEQATGTVATSTPAGAATSPTQLAAPSAVPGMPTIRIRTGQHPEYFRVAFDWPSQTAYRVERRGDALAVIFSGAAAVDAGALNQSLPVANRGAAVSRDGNDTVVTLLHSAQKQIRDFTSGNTIVVDLLDTPSAGAPAQQQVSQSTPAPSSPPAVQNQAPAPSPPARAESAAAIALTDNVREATQIDSSGQRVTRAAVADNAQVDPLTARPAVVSLNIPWSEPAAAAVFRRAEYL